MGLISALFEKRSSLAYPEDWLVNLVGGGKAVTGINVNETTALNYSAVFGCVRILAETVASLPLPVYRRLKGGGKERATDHFLYSILHDQPNPEMTSLELREALTGHLNLWGNAYAEIERDGAGRVISLWPLRPDHMKVKRQNGLLTYIYTLKGQELPALPAYQIMHLRGLSSDGIMGYSPIRLAKEAIGLGLAAEEFGARFFSNDARPSGVLEHPGTLGEEGHARLKKSWQEAHGGLSQSHRVAILEEGLKFHEVGIPPEDAQFLQTRKFQIAEIARWYRMPLILLAEYEKAATYASVEQFGIQFVVHTIRPWLVRWEQRIKMDLFPQDDTYFAEFLVDGLLRGDIESRYRAYAIGRQNGWLSANHILELENMNPIGAEGDITLVPLNMIPASSLVSKPEQKTGFREQRSAEGRRRLATSFEPLFAETEMRIIRREEADVMRAAKKMLKRRDDVDFKKWLDEFYQEHQEFMQKTWLPVFMTYGEAVQAQTAEEINGEAGMTPALQEFILLYLASHMVFHASSARSQLRRAVEISISKQEDPLSALQEQFDDWKETRSERIAKWETRKGSNAVARETYRWGGVRRLQWVAFGKNCPYCANLNGKIVGIDDKFLAAGVDFQPEGAERPLRNDVDTYHPPGHAGCDCVITSA